MSSDKTYPLRHADLNIESTPPRHFVSNDESSAPCHSDLNIESTPSRHADLNIEATPPRHSERNERKRVKSKNLPECDTNRNSNVNSIVNISGVWFAYHNESDPVLRGVDLTVERGTCACLMGVNGCGKSTLLNCLLGEHAPQTGSVKLDGREVSRMRALELAQVAAYVPQTHERSFPYKVSHVVLMGRASARGGGLRSPDFDDADLAHEALSRCGILHLPERPYTSLSGGEMQMLMLARALVQDTPLIIMDEPTAHLDFRNQMRFLETVERLVRDEGITVVMATHAPNEAFHLSAAGVDVKVALMADGVIVREGAPEQVFDSDSLAQVFGIDGFVADTVPPNGHSTIKTIVPMKSLASESYNTPTSSK